MSLDDGTSFPAPDWNSYSGTCDRSEAARLRGVKQSIVWASVEKELVLSVKKDSYGPKASNVGGDGGGFPQTKVASIIEKLQGQVQELQAKMTQYEQDEK